MKKTTLSILLLFAGLFCSLNSYANTFYWTGSSSANWNTLGNWKLTSCSGSTPTSLPGTSDSVVFSGGCSNNNCTINVSISVLSFRIDNAYTGTITQGSGNTITASYGKFADGTFSGGSSAITFSTSLTIEGGTFTTTSGTTTIEGNFSYTSGTFYPNGGRVVFYKTLTVSGVNSSSAINLYDVEFQAVTANSAITLSNIILNVADSTLLTGAAELFINSSQTTSVINVSGDIKIYNTSTTGGGDATIIINGSSTQHITGNATTENVGKLPNLTINSTGTVYLIGNITMGGSTTLTYTAGTINAGTSRVIFYYDNTITGSMTFNNVEFQGTSSTCVVSNTITVNGNMYNTLTGIVILSTGTINLYGNLVTSNTWGSLHANTCTVNFTGTENDSLIATSGVAVEEGYLPVITINKTGGTLYFSGIISVGSNWTNNYSTANINPGTATFYFYGNNSIGGTYSTPVWNAEFGNGGSYGVTINADSALIVRHNLTFIGGSNYFAINGNSINVYGNILPDNTNGGDEGSTIFNLVGSANDSIISPSGFTLGECWVPNISINKTGGTLYLSGIISLHGNWTNNYSQTGINPGTSTLYFDGIDTVRGSYRTSVWNAEFGSAGHEDYYINSDSGLIVKNNLILTGGDWLYSNGNSINVYGNILADNTGGGDEGNTIFNLVGSANDSIISPSGFTLGECELPTININKSGGTLHLIGNITEDKSWDYVAGTVNAGTSTVGMYGYGDTITGATGSDTMSFNNLVIVVSAYLGSAVKIGGNLTINSAVYLLAHQAIIQLA